MTAWLSSIVGIVIVGVVVDLLTQGRRMGNFVRSIYAFVVLFVIVSPLPDLLKKDWGTWKIDNLVNMELVDKLTDESKQMSVSQVLRTMGYDNAIVTVVDDTIYVNLGVSIDETAMTELQKALGEEVIVI